MLSSKPLVVVRGAGDLASGVIYRLRKVGFPVLVLELAQPLVIRRAVAFASAVFDDQITVEGLTARRVDHVAAARDVLIAGEIPVLVDESGASLVDLRPAVVVDARMMKRNLDTALDDAPLVIALGPGYVAGQDCHAVIETRRGHTLGRVIWQGAAAADTGKPGRVKGHESDRVLRAGVTGRVVPQAAIGDVLHAGQVIGVIHDPTGDIVGRVPAEAIISAPFDGVLRGLIHPSVSVSAGMKIGDIDPRGIRAHCFTISDKALAVGGGVLEAVLSAPGFASPSQSTV